MLQQRNPGCLYFLKLLLSGIEKKSCEQIRRESWSLKIGRRAKKHGLEGLRKKFFSNRQLDHWFCY